MRIPALALVVFSASVLPSNGQTPGGSTPSSTNKDVPCGSFAKPAEEIGKLRNTYFQGNWHKLQEDTRTLLNLCTFNADGDLGIPAGTLDVTANYVFVVIPAANGAGEPSALRYLVRNPASSAMRTTPTSRTTTAMRSPSKAMRET